MANILVLNGPNLNMLGKREPEHYGRQTLSDIIEELETLADEYEVRLHHFQSNAEHELVERVQEALDEKIDFILINPAAFTHTSVALRDAMATVKIPFIEIHLSNIHKREDFRQHSFFSDLAEGVIAGLGPIGYQLALAAAVEKLK
ncbi:type II 3-dehydroquinate dehydratase [Hydrogenovibrio sp. JE_KL2]|jgi:3-dehydroquinate dehydratase-2|uniref:type II 3-dehydroquinate dehydratase n=1 Tax=Hydrogenovibrio sp. JE_KL2 TaxID=2651188 RepID=UPI00128E77FE|nr:type II 3-dehydroquinate dehydratase [Hydrogenovibrio sp. JE_KL2]MBD3821350.1 type II 3-dehydroquinate dehydratase [Thiotrichales bacterium]MPQ76759.1 type II 3-dehydroquinate dehydratase [Hydrogenovibrio sp. JE_KL2]